MQLTKTHKILIGLITAAILVSFIVSFVVRKNISKNTSSDNASTTTTQIPGTNISVENNGQYTITPIPVENTKPIAVPDLNRAITFSSTLNLSDEAKKILTDSINNLQNSLKKDPKNIGSWILLGTNYKITGDYAGAVLYWKYAADASNDSVSLGNLGNLYAYYLKDNAMAETYYKKAISRAPTQAYLYIQLSDVYRLIFKDSAKATAILDEGLKQIPNDHSLLDAKKRI